MISKDIQVIDHHFPRVVQWYGLATYYYNHQWIKCCWECEISQLKFILFVWARFILMSYHGLIYVWYMFEWWPYT